MNYSIINKETKAYFAGFTKSFAVKWTNNKRKAYSATFSEAKTQASTLIAFGHNAQRKLVSL
jgi:hypothetical protein